MKEKSSNFILGIDEAGLGPILGPLVIGGVVIEEESLEELKNLGVKDSKLFGSNKLSRIKRKEVWEKATPYIKNYTYKIIPAQELDKNNMYDLETQAIAEILTELGWKSMKTIYIAQLGGMSLQSIFKKLQEYNPEFSSENFFKKVIYEKKADVKYIVVGLASIIAKTIRDEEVLKICQEINHNYISGYPNRCTEIFLRSYFEKHNKLPPQIRKSRNWQPLQELLQKESNL